ncbi:hypothetical protein BCR34DRAFT_373867 [Clohesyomyces aquaticus]|uniref:Dystroglycan-type cadherin-like domain-containing protein n=1 Tax=Clohesyomyces aquaticus TaxID=1231657 RepID=A0A1Y1ZGL7_9PLEO|nr:hypothetical protein BCR34DRAFT_373867 [Clohesyomyces aquaticus]
MWILFVWVAVVIASPQVNFPLNSQFPPVARVGEPFNFQFASNTFGPNSDKLQYSITHQPGWLTLDNNKRTLSGTPGPGDAGVATFTIIAAGEAGAVVDMDSKLLVKDSSTPAFSGNISLDLSKAGPLSGPKSITLPPSKPFQVAFAKDTFQSAGTSLTYHATLTDHTPLPAWISFDSSDVQFSGTTPAMASSPQSYEILLIASEDSIYAAASASFVITVSGRQLLFKPVQRTITLRTGDLVNVGDLRTTLFLDGSLVSDSDIESATAELPDWLSFDNRTLAITGTPPSGLMSEDIGIIVRDNFGDSTQASIHLAFRSQLFGTEIGDLNITAGKYFEYKMPEGLLARSDELISLDCGAVARWLHFEPTTSTVSGTVPADTAPSVVEAILTAKSSDGKSQDSQTIKLHVTGEGAHHHSSSTPSSTTSTQSSPASDAASPDTPPKYSKSRTAAVVAGTVVSAIAALLFIVAIALLCCRRRKGLRKWSSPRSPKKADISRPIPIEEQWEDMGRALDGDLERGKDGDTPLELTPERPPQLDLDLTVRDKGNHSTASSIGEGEAKILTTFERSSWGLKLDAGPSHCPPDSMKIPTAMARKESETLSSPCKRRQRTTAIYRDIYNIGGLPVSSRLTGLEDGRLSSRPNINFSWSRRPLSCDSATTRRTSALSATPSAFPRPPAARHTTQLTIPIEKRYSIRAVSSDVDSLLDRRTLDEKRKSYIRKRVSTQSPFFGASSSRLSASSYRSAPQYMTEFAAASKPPSSPLAPSRVVKPNDEIEDIEEVRRPESLHTRKTSATSCTMTGIHMPFPEILRSPPSESSFVRHTTNSAADRVNLQDLCERPNTAVCSRPAFSPQYAAHDSNRAQELNHSLNSLTGSKTFQNEELSDSVYSSEEEDIEDYEEKRDTITPSKYTLPPLKLDPVRKSKVASGRLSQREPTPYTLLQEHGGKENMSSIYNLAISSKGAGKNTVTNPSTSPERPKLSTDPRKCRSTYHARAESRTAARGTQRHSENRPPTRQRSHQCRHSGSQSRSSVVKQHGRDRSRPQSSAFPRFDPLNLPLSLTNPTTTQDEPSTITRDNKNIQSNKPLPKNGTKSSLLPRSTSGNLLNYADHEEPQIEELESGSIGLRTSNGRIAMPARQSRLAQLTVVQKQKQSRKRDTAIRVRNTSTSPSPTSVHAPASNGHSARGGVLGLGIGLDLLTGRGSRGRGAEDKDTRSHHPDHYRQSQKTRENPRTPPSVLETASRTGNAGVAESPSPTQLKIHEGNARRPVSVEVEENGSKNDSGRRRRTWGSLKAVMSRARYDGKQSDEERGNEYFL